MVGFFDETPEVVSAARSYFAVNSLAFRAAGRPAREGCINHGLKGYKDGTFKPKNSITRVEAVKIMNAVLGLKIEKADLDKAEPKFVDVPKSHWAYYEIMTAATKYIKPKPDTEKKKDEAK